MRGPRVLGGDLGSERKFSSVVFLLLCLLYLPMRAGETSSVAEALLRPSQGLLHVPGLGVHFSVNALHGFQNSIEALHALDQLVDR